MTPKVVDLIVNGRKVSAQVDDDLLLIRFLREELSLTGAKSGCAQGHCGACTVIIDGKARRSCLLTAAEVDGSHILTIEGLAKDGESHPIQRAFAHWGAIQCGFCTPGMVMASKALLDKTPSPCDSDIKEALAPNYCRCGGYARIIDAVKKASYMIKGQTPPEAELFTFLPAPMASVGKAIGASVLKKDALGKATGTTKFVDDQRIDGMLYGKVLWSDQPHANILSIDTSAAKALPGVAAVLTHEDVPGLNKFGVTLADQPVLASDRVRSVGDAVAAVFAESEAIAQGAIDLIKVEYQPLEVISDPMRALEPDAPILHEGGNILIHKKFVKGDVDEGFAESDLIVENSYTTPFVEHAYLEPESGIALPTGDGGVEVRMATQAPYRDRGQIAASLNLPLEKVRIAQTPVGGGFGGKQDITVQIILALGAQLTKKPVKITLSRKESLRASTKRPAFHMVYKTGVAGDGTFIAQQINILGDSGAYASLAPAVLDQALVFACGPYVVPNVKGEAIGVYTNNIRCGAMRGFGVNQVAFALESQIDIIARKLKIDPFEIRLINALERGKRTWTGQIVKESVAIKETLIKAKECLNSMQMPKVKGKLGIGVASGYKNVGMGRGTKDSAAAAIELKADGRVLVKVGTCDMGQGADTVMAQLAAHALDLDYNSIDVVSCDTLLPYGGPTVGQRGTYVTGNAVLKAADQFKKLLIKRVADDMGLDPSKLNFSKGVFADPHTGKIILKLVDLARSTVAEGEKLEAEVMHALPKTYPLKTAQEQAAHKASSAWQLQTEADELPPDSEEYKNYSCFSFVTHVAVIEVNEDTGTVKVHKIIAAHDCGKLLNPLIALGQIEGSVIMGMGYGLSEEFVMRKGLIVTDTLGKCRIPGFKQTPDITTIIIEDPEPGGPLGAKGISEVATVPTAPAIVNAIDDAIGVRITSLPANRKKILGAL